MEGLEQYYKNDRLTLYPVQKDAIQEAILRRYFLVLGEPGSGKTIISIFIIKIWFALKLVKKVLILTKREVTEKYRDEILAFVPGLKDEDVRYMKSNKDRDMFDQDAKVYICDYHQFKLAYFHSGGPKKKPGAKRAYFKKILPIDFDWGIFFDEIQALKNVKSDFHKIVYANTKEAKAKIATSGTPIEKIDELYAIFRILDESIIKMNYHFFMNTIAQLDGDTYRILFYKEQGVRQVRKRIDPFIKVVKKSDITKVVNNTVLDIRMDFTEEFRKAYWDRIDNLMYTVDLNGRFRKRDIAPVIQPIYNKVREVSLENPRFLKLKSMVKRITINEKLVIWDRSPEIIQELARFFNREEDIKSLYIDGSVPKDQRGDIIKQFDTDEDCRLLVVSYLTSAEAWEIPSRADCRRMIFYSIPDRLINYQQCIDRFARLNSKVSIFIYRLVLNKSIDEWALYLLEYKRKLNDGLINEQEFRLIEEESFRRFLGEKPSVI